MRFCSKYAQAFDLVVRTWMASLNRLKFQHYLFVCFVLFLFPVMLTYGHRNGISMISHCCVIVAQWGVYVYVFLCKAF